MSIVEVVAPIRTVSALNHREHWAKRARRVKGERAATLVALSLGPGWRAQAALRKRLAAGARLAVLLERRAARGLDDDNLRAALKGVRDEIARWLGVDDRDPRVRWDYAEVKASGFAVRIRFDEVIDV